MGLYELNKELTVARQRGYIFNQRNKLKIKFYSSLSKINIHYYLKHQIPKRHGHFSDNYLKIVIIFKHIVTIEEMVFILYVLNGNYITIDNVDILYLHPFSFL